MKLIVSAVQGWGFTEVTAQHNGTSLIWKTGKAYNKVKLSDPQRIFKEFNSYMEYMGPEVQDAVWNALVKIRDVMNMSMDGMRMMMTLQHYIKELYVSTPMNSYRNFLLTVGNIHIPADIERMITDESRYNNADQTYLRHDFINLASVALALRPLIPIWGEYIDQSEDDALYKENEVVSLLDNCEMTNWPLDEPGPDGKETETVFDKLAAYVRFCVNNQPATLARLWISGMSSVEIPVHLCSRVLVRRLTIIPLDDPNHHSMISNIYRYVFTNLNPPERSTTERVNEKRPEGGADDDDKTSFIEAHKTKMKVSPGDIVAFDLDALDIEKLVVKVDPTVDLTKLEMCMAEVSRMAQHEVFPHQVLLAQWVMAKAFPERAFSHISKVPVNTLLAGAQALLWHWGYRDLAVFMQVELFKDDNLMSVNQFSAPRVNTRILAKYKDEMNRLFPHERRMRIPNNGVEPEPLNIAGIAITSLNSSIRASHWIYCGPEQLFQEANQIASNRVLIAPANIKSTITELVLKLGEINS